MERCWSALGVASFSSRRKGWCKLKERPIVSATHIRDSRNAQQLFSRLATSHPQLLATRLRTLKSLISRDGLNFRHDESRRGEGLVVQRWAQ